MTVAPASVELADIQGLLRSGYKRHTEAVFLLLRVRDRVAARSWLAQVRVTSAQDQSPLPDTVLQAALSADGLRALGVADDVVAAFAPEFVGGLGGNADCSRRLGDVGANDPVRWLWGSGERTPHLLLLLYALPGGLDRFEHMVSAEVATGFDAIARLATVDLGGSEPFGFTDGISQPDADWQRRRPVRDQTRLDYDNLVCLGEFVLGYPNEYGGYTDRPLLDPARDPGKLLTRAEDSPAHADLGRNGSYLVLRQLEQDVTGFWRWLDEAALGDATGRELLAAAMVGRTRAGEPLAGCADRALNRFDYRNDPEGLRCPLGAHVRRANPRTADMPAGTTGWIARLVRTFGFDAAARRRDLVASARFHRLIRRGRAYGPPLPPAQALAAVADGVPRGLHFIGLNAAIARQFEFVQGAWIASTRFAGLSGESDPLLGHRLRGLDGRPTDAFSMPREDGPDRRLTGLPRFVTVRGGGYFFLPGLRALRYLATAT